MKGRFSFQRNAVYHIYQNTVGGQLIFYSGRDYLVFYTYIAMAALRSGVRILGLCLMPDHIHILVQAESAEAISAFVDIYTIGFVKEYNSWYDRRGPLFNPRFGRAAKVGAKKIRTALAYLYNNPVEKRLSSTAEDYRWNFLKYAVSDNPFSEKLLLEKAPALMRRAIAMVKALRSDCQPLRYSMLRDCTAGMIDAAIGQLTDRIIVQYRFVDYRAMLKYYGSDYSMAVLAFRSNTGSEYDINEISTPGSDTVYYKMAGMLMRNYGTEAFHRLFAFSEDEKREWAYRFSCQTDASRRQIEKFLRLGIK